MLYPFHPRIPNEMRVPTAISKYGSRKNCVENKLAKAELGRKMKEFSFRMKDNTETFLMKSFVFNQLKPTCRALSGTIWTGRTWFFHF